MRSRDLSYEAWLARRKRAASTLARLRAQLPPYRRERLRSEDEAAFLRSLGTPERLIGPVGSDDEVDEERAELVTFARELRTRARRD